MQTKRLVVIGIALVLSFGMLASCSNPLQLISIQRMPTGQAGTQWASEDGFVTFEVESVTQTSSVSFGELEIRSIRTTGTIELNDDSTVKFFLLEDVGTIWLYSRTADMLQITDETLYESWTCKYKSKKEFVATVEKTTFFEVGQKITFHRVDD